MKLFIVTGYIYADATIKYLLENGFAWRNENGDVEIYTEPQWLQDTSLSNADWFVYTTMELYGDNIQSLRAQVDNIPWVDPPAIYPAPDDVVMRAIGAPVLPGLEVSRETLLAGEK